MSTSSVMQETRLRPRRTALRDRRGLALAIVLGAQLMIILDLTVVNIALPSIARGLGFSTAGLSWVLNAYTLTFGGLLLLGGRAGDILGRRRVFIVGIILFTAASLAGGLAQSAGWLLAARAAQGVGGAIASPAVLAMIAASFADGRSLGLVLGGVITEWVSWRWVLFINVPIGVLVAVVAPMFLPETARQPGHFDVTGALTSTAGMVSLVYGIIRAAADGWSDPVTLTAFAAAAVLLAGFVWHESRARQPITPLRLFADRRRSGSYLTRLLIVAGMFGMFFFLTQFVQEILGFSPLRAGISFLPMTAALFGVSRLAPRLVSRFRPWTLMVTGMLPVVAGMAWLSRIEPGTGYLAGVLGPMVFIGAGMGVVFVPLTMASLSGVRPEDSGAASSMVNVMQQVGGSLGLAVLVTAAGSAMGHAAGQAAVVHGMSSAFTLAAVLDVLALLVVLTVMRTASKEKNEAAANQ